MLSFGDDIPLLPFATIAILQLHRDQVLPEVTGLGIDEEAAAIVGLDRGRGKGAGGRIIPLIGFSGSFGIEDAAGALDSDGGRGLVLTGVQGGRRGCSREAEYGS